MGFIPAPRWLLPKAAGTFGTPYAEGQKLATLFGNRLWPRIADKTVIDFGCGSGLEALELLQHGAARVIGLDIQPQRLQAARARAVQAGRGAQCDFAMTTRERADCIVSVDSFEHFGDPQRILQLMAELLRPDGEAWISFGPPWYHPYGGHLLSFWPWSHLIFTERSLMRWRSAHRDDGARHFAEVAGGLNQMTLARFERLVETSPLRFAAFMTVPIQRARKLHNRLTREFLTAIVQCQLTRRDGAASARAR